MGDRALGGALPCDAATCRDSSSHMHVACVWLKAEHEETVVQAPASACIAAEPHPPPEQSHIRVQETVDMLQSQLLDVLDEEKLGQIMRDLQVAQTIVVQQICRATRLNRGDVFQAGHPHALIH